MVVHFLSIRDVMKHIGRGTASVKARFAYPQTSPGGSLTRRKPAGAFWGRWLAQRERARADKADGWAGWWRREMEIHGSSNPAELLPDAFARLEQLTEDRIMFAIRQLKADLRKALIK
jgi:hypothetical protein